MAYRERSVDETTVGGTLLDSDERNLHFSRLAFFFFRFLFIIMLKWLQLSTVEPKIQRRNRMMAYTI